MYLEKEEFLVERWKVEFLDKVEQLKWLGSVRILKLLKFKKLNKDYE